MHLHALPADDAAVRRYVEALWLPYQRELASIVDDHALADDVDLVEAELDYRLAQLEDDDHRICVAVDDVAADALDRQSLTDGTGTLAGFVITTVNDSPPVFDRPNRLVVDDLYVRDPYRGTGLARRLLERAADQAHEAACPQLALDVDVDNDRAIAFYDRQGFEPLRRRLVVATDDVAGDR